MTALPWLVLIAALLGLGAAIWLQWWTNAVDYKFISSGKPMWSIPASVPVYVRVDRVALAPSRRCSACSS